MATAAAVQLDRSAGQAVPPGPPWVPLPLGGAQGGYLSYFLSDELSQVAVRGVTLAANNKSDPNLETGTYGLFSTCGHGMRAAVVANKSKYVVFLTRKGTEREIVGYYRIAWYAPGKIDRKPPDYALAADEVRFIHPGIPVSKLPKKLAQQASRRFRVYMQLDGDTAAEFVRVIESRPNRVDLYLSEIDRLERFNLFRTGFRYVAWKQREKFSWALADKYVLTKPRAKHRETTPVTTSSPTDRWNCGNCHAVVRNKALLKRCPECGEADTLKPLT